VRTYIPEPKRKKPWKWSERPAAERRAVTANHRRVRGARSKKLQRRRSELVERSFAHVCETGGARRCWLHGMLKVSKRYLLQVAARNLGLIMRKLFGMGTPRGLQKEGGAASLAYLLTLMLWRVLETIRKLVVAFANAALPKVQRLRVSAPAT
jgi:transposase